MLLHSDIVGVSVCTYIQGGRESKDTTRTEGRPGLCRCWPSSSSAIWPHSCALPPSSSPVFPPLTASGTLASLDRNRSSILPQQSLQASLNRVAYAWAHTLHLSRNRLSCIYSACRIIVCFRTFRVMKNNDCFSERRLHTYRQKGTHAGGQS